jgi:hypothetical protein
MDTRVILEKKTSNLDVTSDDLDFALEEVQQCVKNYLNRLTIPSELSFTVANMASDLLHASHRHKEVEGEGIPLSEIKQISVGDVSIHRGEERMTDGMLLKLARRQASLDDVLLNYVSQLNKFRLMRW